MNIQFSGQNQRMRELNEETERLELQLKLMRGEVIALTDDDLVLLAPPVETPR